MLYDGSVAGPRRAANRRLSIGPLVSCLFTLALAFPSWAAGGPDSSDSPPSTTSGAANIAQPASNSDHELIQQLLDQVSSLKARVVELESREVPAPPAAALTPLPSPASALALNAIALAAPFPSAPTPSASTSMAPMSPSPTPPANDQDGHNMSIPGGPALNIRGFLDFNLDAGTVANPLIYPLVTPPGKAPVSFQFGEFDLFMSSHLSNTIGFLGEVVFGSDATNTWGLDVERAAITYKPSPYLQISAGRMHSAIGYYNTSFHHGAWFQTATGRPYMYYFEDSGGILPVHIVGIEAAGEIPRTGQFSVHWIAEVGNDEGSGSAAPVENFLSDTDHKAFNIAGYVKRGPLQVGANFYNSVRIPLDAPHVNNTIAGAYLVYISPVWEFMNEFQVQRDHSFNSAVTYNTPLAYTQFSRKFGKYRPYFRWQEVNVPVHDPLYGSVGRYEGPSFGLRMDFADYAALKVQYNRIYTHNPDAMNGLDGQVSFTF
jgi:hypothetical protein